MIKIEETVEKIKNGEESKEILYTNILPYIKMQERKYASYENGRNLDKGEIKTLIWLGIEKAIETYDKSKDCRFTSWAGKHIEYTVKNEYMKMRCRDISLNMVSDIGEELSMEEVIEDENALLDFEKADIKIDGKKAIAALNKLDENERKVVIMTCIKNIPLARVAKGMNMSREKTRTIKLNALKKLKLMISQ